MTTAVQTAGSPAPNASADQNLQINAFMIILMAMLRNLDVQSTAIGATLDREAYLKTQFDAQNKVVADQEAVLKALMSEDVDPKNDTAMKDHLQAVWAQMSLVQQAQTKLSFLQNKMVLGFKQNIDPAEFATHVATMLFGTMLHIYVLTETVR